MKKFFLKSLFGLFFLFLFCGQFTLLTQSAEAYVSVKGYYRKDGTYVRPHVRSNPNGLKYDNYSWTPSQGLYNNTYGTRGVEWDTPTYITDPDYYEGKYLYNSGQYSTNSYSKASNITNSSINSYQLNNRQQKSITNKTRNRNIPKQRQYQLRYLEKYLK